MDKSTRWLLAGLALLWLVLVLGGPGEVEVTVLWVATLAFVVQWWVRRNRRRRHTAPDRPR